MTSRPSREEITLLSSTIPVRQVSAAGVPTIHRFYDTSPVSPSGRYIALTEFDYEDRLPSPGDEASVVVRELSTGTPVFRTRTLAWDTQVGAHAQWGALDSQLFFNRMERGAWRPFGVMVDITTGHELPLGGTVYMVSPCGRYVASPDLLRIGLVQAGYGVTVPPDRVSTPRGASADDGLFITDTVAGTSRLVLSFRDIYESFPDEFRELRVHAGGFHGFHTKWSPDGERILFIIRWKEHGSRAGSRNWVITSKPDGSDPHVALGAARWRGGHHPNWCPDSDRIVMNLAFPNRVVPFPRLAHIADRAARRVGVPFYRPAYSLRLSTFRFDGSDLKVVAPSQLGSGHPTWHDGLSAILTDAYPSEPVTAGDGTVPLRLVSVVDGTSDTLVTVRTRPDFTGPRQEWRVDPHPAWNRKGDQFTFNACPDGVRGVYVADMREVVSAHRPRSPADEAR